MKTPERPKKGSCWCTSSWKRTRPRNHQQRCIRIWEAKMKAAESAKS